MNKDRKKSILIVYGSSSGTTEQLAGQLKGHLQGLNREVTLRNVRNIKPDRLRDYDVIVTGCSTWEGGTLQMDFIPFAEAMSSVDLSGKRAAVFGPGEKLFLADFCRAVDMLEDRLRECGAEIILPGLKMDMEGPERLASLGKWARGILMGLEGREIPFCAQPFES